MLASKYFSDFACLFSENMLLCGIWSGLVVPIKETPLEI
ncbi:hypothetical protein T4B_10049 [Trichinella pseudospiralis]|uniref:Uncharacterized protein n=1 Tax=Trichinella pseudospiralis TaxID=6337 RepID=A0A0V1GH84_TRIPS|nr:hypothetical protein T4B_10049 [Trichinella pseudospiralis]